MPTQEFSPPFDYNSIFEYGTPDISMKTDKENFKSAFSYHVISNVGDESENNFKETWFSALLRNTITLGLYVLAFFLFPISIFTCFKKVQALERIVLLRLGKLQPIRGPGFTVIFPCIDIWTRVDLRPKQFTVSTAEALTADGGIVEVKSNIEYRVSDVISYVLKLHQQESTLRQLSLFCLGNIISNKDQEDLELKREIINTNFMNELNRSTINWGLEIICVNLYSVKVLKSAEPADTLRTIVNALKAVTHQSSQHSVAAPPFIPDIPENKSNVKSSTSCKETNPKNSDILDQIKNLAEDFIEKGGLKDLHAKFRLDITGSLNKNIIICFDEGKVSVFQDEGCSLICDVAVNLSEDVLKQYLGNGISLMDAYISGKVTVTGDWKLLKVLARILY